MKFWDSPGPRRSGRKCVSCGEVLPGVHDKKYGAHCVVCWREKHEGYIPKGSVHFLGGVAGPKDDDSPWGENNVRIMEGD